jgi:hypothetical protein
MKPRAAAARLPVPVLNAALAAFTFSILESGNDGTWSADGAAAAVSVLVAAGVAPEQATEVVHEAVHLARA